MAGLVVVIATASAWWAGSRGPVRYGAEAEVLVQVPDGAGRQEADRRLATQAVVLRGGGVLGPAAEQLGLGTVELRRRVDIGVVADSQVLRVRATADSRDGARRIVTAVLWSSLEQSASVGVPAPTVVSPPRELGDPVAPTPQRAALLGALAGAALAAAALVGSLLARRNERRRAPRSATQPPG